MTIMFLRIGCFPLATRCRIILSRNSAIKVRWTSATMMSRMIFCRVGRSWRRMIGISRMADQPAMSKNDQRQPIRRITFYKKGRTCKVKGSNSTQIRNSPNMNWKSAIKLLTWRVSISRVVAISTIIIWRILVVINQIMSPLSWCSTTTLINYPNNPVSINPSQNITKNVAKPMDWRCFRRIRMFRGSRVVMCRRGRGRGTTTISSARSPTFMIITLWWCGRP